MIGDERFRWFVLGFLASREGWNGEVPAPELAPSAVFCDGLDAGVFDSLDDAVARPEVVDQLRRQFKKEVAKSSASRPDVSAAIPPSRMTTR